jgi:hypothetical protein
VARGGTVSLASRLFTFPRESPSIFGAVLFTRGTTRVFACRLLFWLRLPYDLARVDRAEPYLTDVAVVAEVVELLRVRVLPAAARAGNRGSEKRRVMHNGCYAITVRITYYS